MISLALRNDILTVIALVAGLLLFWNPAFAEDADEGTGSESETDETNPYEDAVVIIDDIEIEGSPTGTDDRDKKEDRKAFYESMDEGVELAKDGLTDEAIEVFTNALSIGYPSATPYYNIALTAEYDDEGARYKGDNLNYAIAFYKKALNDDESYYAARYNLGVLYHKMDMVEEAELTYRELLDVGAETEKNARYNLAIIFRDKQRLGESIEILENADEPYSEPEPLLLLALLYEENGASSRAIRLYKKALELDLPFDMSSLAIKKISELRGY
jgi:tetratricopeptide (TPR) repeat protein